MILDALENWHAQLSPGSNQVQKFWSMLEKIDFQIGLDIFFGQNFWKIEKSKIEKTRISIENFRKSIIIFLKSWFSKIFNWNPCFLCFPDFPIFEIFDRKKISSQISKSIFSNIDQKFSTWLDPGESWASPLSTAPKIIANRDLTPKLTRSTSGVPKLHSVLHRAGCHVSFLVIWANPRTSVLHILSKKSSFLETYNTKLFWFGFWH